MKKFFVLIALFAFIGTANAQEAATEAAPVATETTKPATCSKSKAACSKSKAACSKSKTACTKSAAATKTAEGKFTFSEAVHGKLVADGYEMSSCKASGTQYATKKCEASGTVSSYKVCSASGKITKTTECGKTGNMKTVEVSSEELLEGEKVVKEAKVKGTAVQSGSKKKACCAGKKASTCGSKAKTVEQ